MLIVTENILRSLEESNILEALLHNKPNATDITIPYSVRSHITSSTKLIITGHSLGGGVASLLSMCLQQDFPNECYAFDPPGQTISLSLRHQTLATTYTTVMGDDMFPRLSTQPVVPQPSSVVSPHLEGPLLRERITNSRGKVGLSEQLDEHCTV